MSAIFLPNVVGTPQIILIVVVVLLLFGGKKIPEMMKGLGTGLKEFKDASREDNVTSVQKKEIDDKIQN